MKNKGGQIYWQVTGGGRQSVVGKSAWISEVWWRRRKVKQESMAVHEEQMVKGLRALCHGRFSSLPLFLLPFRIPPRFKFECRKCLNCFQWHIPPNLLGGWYHKGIIWLLNSIFLACTPPQARILQIPSNGALNLNQILLSSLVL